MRPDGLIHCGLHFELLNRAVHGTCDSSATLNAQGVLFGCWVFSPRLPPCCVSLVDRHQANLNDNNTASGHVS